MSFAVSKSHSSAAGQDAFHSSIVGGGEGGLWQASSPQSRQEVMALCLFDSRVQRVTLLPYSSRVTSLILSLSAYIIYKCLHAFFSGITIQDVSLPSIPEIWIHHNKQKKAKQLREMYKNICITIAHLQNCSSFGYITCMAWGVCCLSPQILNTSNQDYCICQLQSSWTTGFLQARGFIIKMHLRPIILSCYLQGNDSVSHNSWSIY